jgi:hypothetical protein
MPGTRSITTARETPCCGVGRVLQALVHGQVQPRHHLDRGLPRHAEAHPGPALIARQAFADRVQVGQRRGPAGARGRQRDQPARADMRH